MEPIKIVHIVDIILCTITKKYSFLNALPFPGQLNGFLPIQLEMVKILTTSAIYLARYFSGISFLGSQLVISSEIHKNLFMIQSLHTNGHGRDFD